MKLRRTMKPTQFRRLRIDAQEGGSQKPLARSGHALLSALVESPSSSYRLDECDILDASVALTDRTNEFSFAQQVDATSISKPVEVPCFGVSLRRTLANARWGSRAM